MALKSINGILKADIKSINGVLAAIAAAGLEVALLDSATGTGSSAVIVSPSVSPVAGSMIFIVVANSSKKAITSVVSGITTGTWRLGLHEELNSTKNPGIDMWYATVTTGSGTITATLDANAGIRIIQVYQVTGHNVENWFANTNTATDASADSVATLDVPNTPAADGIIFGAISNINTSVVAADTVEPGGGFTEIAEDFDDNATHTLWLQCQHNDAAIDKTVDWSGTEQYEALLAFEIQKKGTGDGADLGTDLAAWWPMDEASGSRIDRHINGYDLTDNNTVLATTGKVGTNAALFASANSENFTRTSAAEAWRMNTNDMTIGLWVKFTSFGTGANQELIGCGATTNTSIGYIIQTNSSGTQLVVKLSDGSTRKTHTETLGTAFSTGVWYYLIIEFDRDGNMAIWKDDTKESAGLDISSFSAADITSASALSLSVKPAASTQYMDGAMDEVVISNRLWTAAEKTWMSAGRAYEEIG